MSARKENFARSTQIARAAIPFMSERAIPITPTNYLIWYEYYDGRKIELKEEIDQLKARNALFDEDLHLDLYRRHFERTGEEELVDKMAGEMAVLDKVNNAAQRILAPITEDLAKLSAHNRNYAEKLSDLNRSISDDDSAENVRQIVRTLQAATDEAVRENRSVGDHLSTYRQSMDDLRQSLYKAMADARRDDLTGIANRRAFNEDFAGEIEWVKRQGAVSGLVIFDIDKFKRINDTYGHPVGDNALVAIATIVSHVLLGAGRLYRFGGEEFAALIRGRGAEDARKLAESARKAVEANEFTIRGKVEAITISGGVAAITLDGGPANILKRADDALYLAKSSGRNVIKTEGQLDSPPLPH
ncbi:MAG: GGDEF domain-containing protein [Nitrospinae bacterium]|nr:GGDEF domain-containing protein [Nitrospinota bacterium]